MLQYLKEAKSLLFSTLFIFLLLTNCDRDNPTEAVDDGKAPAAPKGLSVFREFDGEVGIEWIRNLESDIKFYNIYRSSDNSKLAKIDSTTSLFYVEYGLKYDSTYTYRISAVDKSGMESPLSDSVYAKPVNLYRPNPPYSLSISARNWNDSLLIKINHPPSFSSDVAYYEIYRSTTGSFVPDSSTLIDTTNSPGYTDNNDLEVLKTYYYKLISVDRGGLKSDASSEIKDIILNNPAAVFPTDNAEVDYFAEFQIQLCSHPADYKIVLQSNEIYGTEVEIDFSSNKTDKVISVPIRNTTFTAYDDYYWRIYTYTKSGSGPNSFSKLYKFTIVPEG